MQMRFWSLGRSGFSPIVGRPSWRVFRAAVAACGLPRPSVFVSREAPALGFGFFLSVGLEFAGVEAPRGRLFRCRLSADFPLAPWALAVLRPVYWVVGFPSRAVSMRHDPFCPAPSWRVAFLDALRFPLSMVLS